MDVLDFPIVALGAALICLIGVTLYAITLRGSLRSRDEQLIVARAQAYAMLELSQAGVLFLDRVTDPTTFSTWAQFDEHHRDEFEAYARPRVERTGS